MQQRLASAAVLVPVVVAVFLWGALPGSGLLVAAGTALAALGDVRACCALAGYRSTTAAAGAAARARRVAGMLAGRRPDRRARPASWRSAPRAGRWRPSGARTRAPGSRPGSAPCSGRSTSACWASLRLIVRARAALPAGAPAGGWFDGGRVWLLVLILAVWSYDTFAYLVGRTFGRRHFLQHISPGKTSEGVIGGLAGGDRRVALLSLAGPANRRSAALLFGPPHRAAGAGRRPRRIDAQARRRREGLGPPHPGSRRACWTGSTRSSSRRPPAAYLFMLVLGAFR